jgi:hypothetical protein
MRTTFSQTSPLICTKLKETTKAYATTVVDCGLSIIFHKLWIVYLQIHSALKLVRPHGGLRNISE